MKRRVIALVAAMAIAGAAGAGIATKASEGSKPLAPSMATTARPAVERASEPRPSVVVKTTPVEAPKASVEVRQAPVPLQLRAHPSANARITDETAPPVMVETATAPSSLAPDQSGETAARAAIEADGYKSVRILSRVGDAWRAKALRGKTEVLLLVDATGSVTTAD